MLDKIWDDTLGGPQPDTGLSRLRKNSTFNTTHVGSGKMQVRSLDVEDVNIKEGSEGNRVIGKQKFYFQRSLSMESGGSSSSPPVSPTAASSTSASSTPRDQENVWRSVFNPGSNLNTKSIGSQKFDKPEAQSPTVYDWLYSGDTRSKWR